jgi:23S rRNA pseudouridine1911/1915/1917 synthase
MVIYKPKGMLSHPNSVWDVSKPSVVWSLYHYFKDQDLPSMGSFIRAGLVHRLDKETDGLMIIAKTEQWLAHFKSLFQSKSLAVTLEEKEAVPLKKFYRATVEVTTEWSKFLQHIKESWTPYLIDADVTPKTPYPVTKRGLTKILGVQLIDNNRAVVDIEILTWRTHQIRVHLSERWLPIVGDYVYGEEAEDGVMHLSSYRLQYSYSWKLYDII